MIHDLNYEDISMFEAELFEAGLIAERWTKNTDARIKSESDPVGIGPVIYSGTPEDSTGKKASDGYIRDAAFLFFSDNRVSVAFLWDISNLTTDLNDTITAYAENRGGSVSAMLAKAPEVI